MEFSEILAAVYEDLQYPTTPDAATITRLKRYVNEGLQAILAEPALAGLIDSTVPYPFSSVADQALYAVPDATAMVVDVRDATNQRLLVPMTFDEYRRRDPLPSVHTGTPSHWVQAGRVAVALQPSNASELFIKSTSASDTGTAYLEGTITGGYKRTASVVMTGTTAVSFSAAITSWVEVTDLYLSAAAVGTVTLLEDSGAGTELARITIGQKRPMYQGMYLWPTPAGIYSYVVDTRQDLALLVNPTDEPPLPRDMHAMLAKYATFRDWERKDDDRSRGARQQYELWLSRLKYRMASLALPVATRRTQTGISRLGAWYPADTWLR